MSETRAISECTFLDADALESRLRPRFRSLSAPDEAIHDSPCVVRGILDQVGEQRLKR